MGPLQRGPVEGQFGIRKAPGAFGSSRGRHPKERGRMEAGGWVANLQPLHQEAVEGAASMGHAWEHFGDGPTAKRACGGSIWYKEGPGGLRELSRTAP